MCSCSALFKVQLSYCTLRQCHPQSNFRLSIVSDTMSCASQVMHMCPIRIPAAAGKAKAGMAHSDCGWTCGLQVKLWNRFWFLVNSFYFFYFGSCGRLSWLNGLTASFRAHVNIISSLTYLLIPWEHVPYPSASAVVIHYEEALYQVYAPLLLLVAQLQTNPSAGWLFASWSSNFTVFRCLRTERLNTV